MVDAHEHDLHAAAAVGMRMMAHDFVELAAQLEG